MQDMRCQDNVICIDCGTSYNGYEGNFSVRSLNKTGYGNSCLKCHSDYMKAYRRRNIIYLEPKDEYLPEKNLKISQKKADKIFEKINSFCEKWRYKEKLWSWQCQRKNILISKM